MHYDSTQQVEGSGRLVDQQKEAAEFKHHCEDR